MRTIGIIKADPEPIISEINFEHSYGRLYYRNQAVQDYLDGGWFDQITTKFIKSDKYISASKNIDYAFDFNGMLDNVFKICN